MMTELVSIQVHSPNHVNSKVHQGNLVSPNGHENDFQVTEIPLQTSQRSIAVQGSEERSNNGNQFLHRCGRSKKDLEFRHLKYHVIPGRGKEDKMILKDISGMFLSGDLTAIMGPSGAGKSSLMNILAGYRTKNISGEIMVNGKLRSLSKFRKMSCYIMQDDHLLPHITVEEAMMCSANLKLDDAMTIAKKKDLVADIIDCLGLHEARQTRCAFLSGGQRKRLSIAQELVNNPPIMFFDEPTSGLDSASCFQCISLLQSLAHGGRTIICTIHQPSAKLFEMFNSLYFLADGHCIYRGPVNQLVYYLKTQELVCPSYHNPADYFMEVACNEMGNITPRLAEAVTSGVLDRVLMNCNKNAKMNKLAEQESLTEHDQSMSVAVRSGGRSRNTSVNENQQFEFGATPTTETGLLDKEKGSSIESIEENKSRVLQRDSQNRLSPNAKCEDATSDVESVTEEAEVHTFASSMFTQFRVLFIRTFISIIRDTTLTTLRLIANLAVGLTIGLLYFQIGNEGTKTYNNAAFVFFCLLFIMFTALMPTVLTFPLEMSVFVREHLNYWYSLKAYYLAKTLADMPFQIIFPIMYSSIVYWLTAQPANFMRFFMFLTISVQTALVGQSIGLVIGAATSLQVAVFLGPVTAIPILLFSGFFVTFSAIPKYLQWLSYIDYIRYAFEGALQAIYGNSRNTMPCDETVNSPCLQAKDIMKLLSVEDAIFFVDFIVLCVFFVILRVLCYFILRWRIKGQK